MERIRKERRTNRGFRKHIMDIERGGLRNNKVSDKKKRVGFRSNKLLVSPTPRNDISCQSMLNPYVCP